MSKDRISEAVDKLVENRPQIDWDTFQSIGSIFNRVGLTRGEERSLSPSQIDRVNDLLRTISSYAGIVSDILDEASGSVTFH